jgi:hypothetical protein
MIYMKVKKSKLYGLIQALNEKRVLQNVDFLSTIGSAVISGTGLMSVHLEPRIDQESKSSVWFILDSQAFTCHYSRYRSSYCFLQQRSF